MPISYSSHKVGNASGTNSIGFSHTLQQGERVLLFVSSLRAGPGSNYSVSALYGSDSMSVLADYGYTSNNRGYRVQVFSIASGGAVGSSGSKTFTINFSRTVNTICYGLVAMTGAASFGRVASDDYSAASGSVTVSAATSTLGVFFGMVAPRINNTVPTYTYTSPATEIANTYTGNDGSQTDQGLSLSYFGGADPASYTLAVTSINQPTGIILVEAIPTSVTDPVGAIGETQSNMPFSGRVGAIAGVTIPTVIVGSIPPTQVNWLGNIGLHTKEETIYVAVALTYGDLWVQPDSSLTAVQSVGVRVKRRKAYLFPR